MRAHGCLLVGAGLAGLGALALGAGAAARLELNATPQASGVSSRLRGVSAPSARVAWASGTGGTILRTTDGGASWLRRAVAGAEGLDFRDVDAFDASVAYALSIGPGEASRIYKTVDGGASWSLQFTNRDPRGFLDAMAFWDERHGLAVGDSIDGVLFVLRTADAGRSWTRVPAAALPPALAGEGAFAASGTNVAVQGRTLAWFATTAARVLRTTDGGASWSVARAPIPSGPSAGAFSVAFRDAHHGVLVGGDYKKEDEAVDNAAVTDDGGVTWRPARGLTGFRSVVAPLGGPRTGAWIALGPSGVDVSSDDGHSFAPVEAPGCHAFALARGPAGGSAARAGFGFCVGEGGRIVRLALAPAGTD